ncbi:cupin domain-containing protein [Lysobacter soli]|uniref:cupin domain-containing protein n=1 Tax=Lysobacter soli TaxID=453783 RepID=UPI003CCD1BB8
MQAWAIDAVPALQIGQGCTRRDLPAGPGVRVWVVDMAPGSQWPVLDHHETGESYYVIAGEVIEGQARFGPGTYVYFAPDSPPSPAYRNRRAAHRHEPGLTRRSSPPAAARNRSRTATTPRRADARSWPCATLPPPRGLQ